jgi:hypothetical protein
MKVKMKLKNQHDAPNLIDKENVTAEFLKITCGNPGFCQTQYE